MNPSYDSNAAVPGLDNDCGSSSYDLKCEQVQIHTEDAHSANLILLQELARERQRVSTLEGIILSMFLSPGSAAEVRAKAEAVNSSIPLLLHGKEAILSAAMPVLHVDPLCPRCPPELRREKIEKYKAKLKKRREAVQLSRSYSGRSHVAKSKPRVNGKFART